MGLLHPVQNIYQRVQKQYWIDEYTGVSMVRVVSQGLDRLDKVKYISYGQYCPLAMASEILCNRWTILVLRELLFGSTSFNDISRGVPRMSRTLLSKRLKELVQIAVIIKTTNLKGKALESVIIGMAGWGQEWLQTAHSLEDLDPRFLMWDIMRNAKNIEILPNPFIAHIHLSDVEDGLGDYWLVFEDECVDLL